MNTLRIYPCGYCGNGSTHRAGTRCPACTRLNKIERKRRERRELTLNRQQNRPTQSARVAKQIALDPAIALYRVERAKWAASPRGIAWAIEEMQRTLAARLDNTSNKPRLA